MTSAFKPVTKYHFHDVILSESHYIEASSTHDAFSKAFDHCRLSWDNLDGTACIRRIQVIDSGIWVIYAVYEFNDQTYTLTKLPEGV